MLPISIEFLPAILLTLISAAEVVQKLPVTQLNIGISNTGTSQVFIQKGVNMSVIRGKEFNFKI